MMMHANFNNVSSSSKFASAGTEGGDESEKGLAVPVDAVPVERAKVDVETNEALEGSRPGEDVFKSVFED